MLFPTQLFAAGTIAVSRYKQSLDIMYSLILSDVEALTNDDEHPLGPGWIYEHKMDGVNIWLNRRKYILPLIFLEINFKNKNVKFVAAKVW